MRVYIAGPMTGYPNYNFPAFHEAQRKLEEQGYTVVNPAAKESKGDYPDPDLIPLQWGGTREDLDPGIIRNRDFQELLTCERIMLLPGWSFSWGARLEAAVAQACGMVLVEIYMDPYRLWTLDNTKLGTFLEVGKHADKGNEEKISA